MQNKPAQETVSVPFYPGVHPTMPEASCGVTVTFPANLYRPLSELRKLFKLISVNCEPDVFSIVDGWLAYEIENRKISAAVLMSQVEQEALSGKRADAKRSAAAAKREKKELEKLESRLSLWYKMTGRENPDDDTTQETETAAAVETETTQETETETKTEKERNKMFNFFENCADVDAARKRYYKLAQVYHSDTGAGDDDTMRIINDQFSAYVGRSAAADTIPALPAGVIALPEHCETPAAVGEAAEYMTVIAALVSIPDIMVEIVGSWVWVSGDTKAHKDEIKAARLHFSGQRREWYWHPVDETKPARRFRASKLSMDEIRDKYGCVMVKSA